MNSHKQADWPVSFREAFCQKHGYPLDQFRRRVFWRCLYPHAVPLAAILVLFRRGHFQRDFDLIDQLGLALSRSEFHRELQTYAYETKLNGNWLHKEARVRVSGKRLMTLQEEVFQK